MSFLDLSWCQWFCGDVTHVVSYDIFGYFEDADITSHFIPLCFLYQDSHYLCEPRFLYTYNLLNKEVNY